MNLTVVYGDPREEMFGGVEEHTKNLIRHLSNNFDTDIRILTYGNRKENFKKNNVKYDISKRSSGNIVLSSLLLPFELYRLMKRIRKQNFDLIHFQGFHPLYCMAAVLCQRKCPTVITLHGISSVEMDYHIERNFIFRYFSKMIEKYAVSKIKNIIVVAPQIEKIINGMTGSKTFMIPNGVAISSIKEIKPTKFNKENIIFFIGNLTKRKGVDVLIRSFCDVENSFSDSCLLIAGSGGEEEELKSLVQHLGLENKIKFLGFLKGNEKFSLMKSANILVLPSLWESLPIVVLEGMACGKPIIASDVGGIPYLVHDGVNGFLIQPGEIKELSNKIITLLEDKKLQEKMGKESLKRSEEFDWNKIALKTYEVYVEIINNNKN
jgi:glycosyltransferase involved in cell wall biosynthesis